MNRRYVLPMVLLLLAAGCASKSPDYLRTQSPYKSSYHSSMLYDAAAKYMLEKGMRREMEAASGEGTPIVNEVYPEQQKAALIRSCVGVVAGITTSWVIDVTPDPAGGSLINVYGSSAFNWYQSDDVVRWLPNLQEVSCWPAPYEWQKPWVGAKGNSQ